MAKDPQVDEFGIPIKTAQPEMDEFGIPIKKKVESEVSGTPSSTGTAPTSPSTSELRLGSAEQTLPASDTPATTPPANPYVVGKTFGAKSNFDTHFVEQFKKRLTEDESMKDEATRKAYIKEAEKKTETISHSTLSNIAEDVATAQKFIEAVDITKDTTPETLFKKAIAYQAMGKSDEAFKVLDDLSAKDPNLISKPEYWVLYGQLAHAKGNIQEEKFAKQAYQNITKQPEDKKPEEALSFNLFEQMSGAMNPLDIGKPLADAIAPTLDWAVSQLPYAAEDFILHPGEQVLNYLQGKEDAKYRYDNHSFLYNALNSSSAGAAEQAQKFLDTYKKAPAEQYLADKEKGNTQGNSIIPTSKTELEDTGKKLLAATQGGLDIFMGAVSMTPHGAEFMAGLELLQKQGFPVDHVFHIVTEILKGAKISPGALVEETAKLMDLVVGGIILGKLSPKEVRDLTTEKIEGMMQHPDSPIAAELQGHINALRKDYEKLPDELKPDIQKQIEAKQVQLNSVQKHDAEVQAHTVNLSVQEERINAIDKTLQMPTLSEEGRKTLEKLKQKKLDEATKAKKYIKVLKTKPLEEIHPEEVIPEAKPVESETKPTEDIPENSTEPKPEEPIKQEAKPELPKEEMKKKEGKYYARTEDGTLEEAKGAKKFSSPHDIDLFKTINEDGSVIISDAKTGIAVVEGKDLHEAQEKLNEKIDKIGIDKIRTRLDELAGENKKPDIKEEAIKTNINPDEVKLAKPESTGKPPKKAEGTTKGKIEGTPEVVKNPKREKLRSKYQSLGDQMKGKKMYLSPKAEAELFHKTAETLPNKEEAHKLVDDLYAGKATVDQVMRKFKEEGASLEDFMDEYDKANSDAVLDIVRKSAPELAIVAENAEKTLGAPVFLHGSREEFEHIAERRLGHSDFPESMQAVIARDTEGKPIEAHVILSEIDSPHVIYHEVAHPIIAEVFGSDPKVLGEFVHTISPYLPDAHIKYFKGFAEQYTRLGAGADVALDEFLTELTARLTADQTKFQDQKWVSGITKALNAFFEKLLGYIPFKGAATKESIEDLFNGIKEGIKSGRHYQDIINEAKPKADKIRSDNIRQQLNSIANAVKTDKIEPVTGEKFSLKQGDNLVPKSWKIDEDKDGNYLFYHYGNIKGDKIDPAKWGKNVHTSDKRTTGVSYFYTRRNQQESVVSGDMYVVKVPKDKVYPFNKDPLNFYDKAKENFLKDHPGGAFDAASQIDYMNPLIQKAGYDMTVAEWGGKKAIPLRAETTKALPYDKSLTEAVRSGKFKFSLNDPYHDKIVEAAKDYKKEGLTIDDMAEDMGIDKKRLQKAWEEAIERDVTGISHRVLGEMGIDREVKGGWNPDVAHDLGSALLKELNKNEIDINEVLNEKNKELAPEEKVALAQAKFEELSENTYRIADALGEDSPEFKQARAEQKDFLEKISYLNNQAQKMLVAFQGETDLKTHLFTSPSYLADTKGETVGRQLGKSEIAHAKELANTIKTIRDKEAEASKKIVEQVIKPKKETPQAVKAKFDKVADNILKGKLSRPGSFSSATPASLVWDGALEVAAATVRGAGSIAQAIADGIEHIKKSDWYNGLTPDKQKAAENDFTDFLKSNRANDSIEVQRDNLRTELSGKQDYNFEINQAKRIWQYAKDAYIDKGVDFDDMVHNLAGDLGLNPNQVRRALASPKGAKPLMDDIYRLRDARRKAEAKARAWAEGQDENPLAKGLKAAYQFKTAITLAWHGGMIPLITHGGKNFWDYRTYPILLRGMKDTFNFTFSKVNHQQAIDDYVRQDKWLFWKRAGVKNDFDKIQDEYQNIPEYMKKLTESGSRAFDFLKIARTEHAQMLWDSLKPEEQTPKMAKMIAEMANTAWGASNVPIGKWQSALAFAPSLEGSRWQGLAMPFKAAGTYAKDVHDLLSDNKILTPEEKVYRRLVFRRAGTQLAMLAASLAAAQGLLIATGSKQRINMTDPSEYDFLKYKFAGRAIDISGGVLPTIHLVEKMGEALINTGKGRRDFKTYQQTLNYARHKLSPLISTIVDFAFRHDQMGNTMPTSNEKPDTPYATQLTWEQYLTQNSLPIPVAEGFRDYATSMKEHGMTKEQTKAFIQAIAIGGLAASTGIKASHDSEEKPSDFPFGK